MVRPSVAGCSLCCVSHLPIESFAEASAEIEAGQAPAHVLQQRGVTQEQWLATREHWLRLIGEEALQHRFELTSRYQAAFLARRQSLEEASKPTSTGAATGGLPFLRDDNSPPPPSRRGDLTGLPFRPPDPPDGHPRSDSYPPPPEPMGGVYSNGPASSSQLELAQLAALAAEISVFPEGIDVARARYGLDEANHRSTSIAWQARFAAEPALFAQYTALFEQYRAMFKNRPGPPSQP